MNIMKNMNVFECGEIKIHPKKIEKLLKDMPDEQIISDLSGLFKVFGDITRIKILYSISKNEMCVCDIAATINMTNSAVSHQLKILKQARLVRARKDGKEVYYSLDDAHIQSIFTEGLEHIKERR